MLGNLDGISEPFEQLDGGDSYGRVVVVCKLISKQIHLALGASGGVRRVLSKPGLEGLFVKLGERAVPRKSRHPFHYRAGCKIGNQKIKHPGSFGRQFHVAGEIGDPLCTGGNTVNVVVTLQEFGFHFSDVNVGRTFTFTAFARKA